MKVREAKFKDFISISKLQSRHKLKSILNYKYKIITNYLFFSKKNPMGWVLEDKGVIRGFVGNFVKKYSFRNKYFFCSSINSLVVDKNYRQNTYLLLRRYFDQKKVLFYLNSTPNDSTYKIWKKLGANEIPQPTIQKKLLYILKIENIINSYLLKKKIFVPYFIIKLITKISNFIFFRFKNNKINSNLNFIELKKFDTKVKFFLKKNLEKSKLFLCRDKLWFKMNYNKKDKKKAFIFLILKKKEIVGLISLIENNNNSINLKRLEIADFIIHKKEKIFFENIIKKIFLDARFKRYDAIEAQGFSEKKFSILKNIFHIEIKLNSFPFLYKSKDKKINKILENNKIWDLSLIDGDNLI